MSPKLITKEEYKQRVSSIRLKAVIIAVIWLICGAMQAHVQILLRIDHRNTKGLGTDLWDSSILFDADVIAHSPTLTSLGDDVALIINSPRIVLMPIELEISPGSCWAFKGDSGFMTFNLTRTVTPKSFSYRHLPASITADSLSSAPRILLVTGYRSGEPEESHPSCSLGQFSLDPSPPEGDVQRFEFPGDCPAIDVVEVAVHGNYGGIYTCLYRIAIYD